MHKVVDADNSFHPESQIEAFKGLKYSERQGDSDIECDSGSEYPPSREKKTMKMKKPPPPSRDSKGHHKIIEGEKLPSLLYTHTLSKKDVHVMSARSDPDFSLRSHADTRRQALETCDALDLHDNHSIDEPRETYHQRSESAPSSLSSSNSASELRYHYTEDTFVFHQEWISRERDSCSQENAPLVPITVPMLNFEPLSRKNVPKSEEKQKTTNHHKREEDKCKVSKTETKGNKVRWCHKKIILTS